MTHFAAGIFDGTHSQRGGIFFKLIFLIFLALFLCVLYVARHPLLRLAGNFWVVDETPEASDVILVLSGDNYDADRATRAAALYKSGVAPRVLVHDSAPLRALARSLCSASRPSTRQLTALTGTGRREGGGLLTGRPGRSAPACL